MSKYMIQRTNAGIVQWYCGEAGDTGPMWSQIKENAVSFPSEETAEKMADEIERSLLFVVEEP